MEQTPSDISASKGRNTKRIGRPKKISKKSLIDPEYRPRVTNNSLSYEEQLKVVNWIAIYKPDDQIIDDFKTETGKDLTHNHIHHYKYYPAWQPMIEKVRDEFESKISEEELSSKRRRIQELSKAYRRLELDDETLTDAVSVLGKIREEVEGKTSGAMSLTQYNQYNGLSDEDLRKVIAENNRFLEIAEKRKNELEGINATHEKGI